MAEWLSDELDDSKSQLIQKLLKEEKENTSETIIQLIHTLTVEEKAKLMKRLSNSTKENLSMEQFSKSIGDNLEDKASSNDNKDSSQNSEN